MGKAAEKSEYVFELSISKREAKTIDNLPEQRVVVLRRKMLQQLRAALVTVQDYQKLME